MVSARLPISLWHSISKTEEAIKSKVYRWSGIIRELETTKEEVHVYFLTTSLRHTNLTSLLGHTYR